jgi:hypothetical protein
MLSASDNGGGGTAFYSMDVPTMWALVANQDTTAHYEMLSGWQKSYELILEHLAQVQNYRENLVAAWPPEKSPASAAYVAQLDDLVTHLQKTYDAAIANHTAFAGATLSLSLSRNDLKVIYDQYTANQAKLDAFNAAPKPLSSGKAVAPPLKPPVTAGQQEQLNNQARVLMSQLSTDLVQAQTSLTTPPEFLPPTFIDDKEKVYVQTFTPPVIPPIVPTDSDFVSSSSHGTSAHSVGSSIHAVEPPATTGVRQPGLVLGGVNSPLPITPLTNGGGPILPTGGGPLPNVIAQPPILPPVSSSPFTPGLTPTSAGTMRSIPGEAIGRIGPADGVRPMSPGGVIGGTPGVGQPAIGRGSAQRVNPVGGVINNSTAKPGSGPRGSGSSTPGQAMSSASGRAGRRGESDDSTIWDPDNPWKTAKGVSPVVMPIGEQRVDPGPAIGLD